MPAHHPSPFTDENRHEKLLRAAFYQHASVNIDVDHAWRQVAQRLPSLHQQAKQPSQTRFPFWFSGKQPHKRLARNVPLVAAIALMAVLLMGAGVTSPWGNALQQFLSALNQPVSANQFQAIGQQQQSNGVKITLEDAYADPDHIIISFTAQLSPDLLKAYWGMLPTSFDFVVNGQKETLMSQSATCVMNFGRDRSEYCVWILSPMHISSSTKKLDITWHFTTINLKKRVPVRYDTYTGHWQFHFTVPFHQQRHDPGKPPTPTY